MTRLYWSLRTGNFRLLNSPPVYPLFALEFAPHCGCFDPWGNVQPGDGEGIHPGFADPLVRYVDTFHNEAEYLDFIEVRVSECCAEFTVREQHKVS